MSPAARALLQDAIDNADYTSRSYSGRGMFGTKCLAVECDDGPIVAVIDILTEVMNLPRSGSALAEVVATLRKGKTNALGTGQILYFPSVPFEGEDFS